VNRRNRRLRTVLLLASAVLVVGAALALDLTHALQRLEYASVNERFNIRGRQTPPDDVVVVAIDDKSFEELDARWPFRRTYHAQVIRNLTRAGAKVIAYDVQFTEPDADHPGDDDKLIEAVRAQPRAVMATTEVDPNGKTHLRRRARAALQPRGPLELQLRERLRRAHPARGLQDRRPRDVPAGGSTRPAGRPPRRPQGQQRLDRLQGRHPEPAPNQLLERLQGRLPRLGG
jgi:hypothetical protein